MSSSMHALWRALRPRLAAFEAGQGTPLLGIGDEQLDRVGVRTVVLPLLGHGMLRKATCAASFALAHRAKSLEVAQDRPGSDGWPAGIELQSRQPPRQEVRRIGPFRRQYPQL